MGTQLPLLTKGALRLGDNSHSPKKGHSSPIFDPCLLAGWMKMPVDMEVGLDPSDIVLDGDPAPPPEKRGLSPPGGAEPPNFRPISILTKRLHGSRYHLVWG